MADKKIYDPLHGYVHITPLMKAFIDTPEFQRLRDIKQLGVAHLVFPSATHTRFEHSIGVSHLGGLVISNLKQRQPELNITDRMIELVRIAALMHDIGHAPFSHVFDNEIVASIDPDYFKGDPHFAAEHEDRSCKIIAQMVKDYNLPMTESEVDFVQRLIVPGKEDNTWIFQIIANGVNEIDVDKIDYIQRDGFHLDLCYAGKYSRILLQGRVIDDQLCYPEKLKFEIYSLFHTRFRLHKEIYNHPVAKAYEYVYKDLFLETLKEHPNVPFIQLTEPLILSRFNRSPVVQELFRKIDGRHHIKLLSEYVVHDSCETSVADSNATMVQKYHIGFVGKHKTNPLHNVWYYKMRDPLKKYRILPRDISPIISGTYHEQGVRIYK